MKIAVCLKQVPSTETRVKVDSSGKRIDASGVSMVINPYDEFAVEEALQLKDKHGGEVVIVTVGGGGAVSAIRNALAMGADSAIHLKTESIVDPYGTAKLLAAELDGGGYDLILCGKQAVDDDAAQVGVMLAERLGLPCATVVVKLEVDGSQGKATREIEGGHETLSFSLPAVVCAQKGLNEPRYASLKGIMAAKKKPVEEKGVEAPPVAAEALSLALPAARESGRIVGEGAAAVDELVKLLREEAKVL